MKEGDIFKVKAPFIKVNIKVTKPFFSSGDDYSENKYYWQHGINFEDADEYTSNGFVEHEGYAEYKIIKIVEMPKPYHDRILYRKRLTEPEGKILKWERLLMIGPKGFETLKNGKWSYELI